MFYVCRMSADVLPIYADNVPLEFDLVGLPLEVARNDFCMLPVNASLGLPHAAPARRAHLS